MHSEEDSLNRIPSGKSSMILETNEKCLTNIFVDTFIQGKSTEAKSYVTLHRCDISDLRMLFLSDRSTTIQLIFISLKQIGCYAKV